MDGPKELMSYRIVVDRTIAGTRMFLCPGDVDVHNQRKEYSSTSKQQELWVGLTWTCLGLGVEVSALAPDVFLLPQRLSDLYLVVT
jgi:hypothetical protein